MIDVIRNIGHMIRNIGHMTSNSVYLFRIVYDVIRNIGHMTSNSVCFFRIAGDVISNKMNLVWIFGDVIRNVWKFRLFWREVDFNTLDAFSQIIFLKSNFFEITQRQKQCFKNLVSVSKKPGQIGVLYHYCGLSKLKQMLSM